MLLLEFIVDIMLTLNSEVIEGVQSKENDLILQVNTLKDSIRVNAIADIVNLLVNNVLANHHQFKPVRIKQTLYCLAQLIDWNELRYFEGLIMSCMALLKNTETRQVMKNGAFNCIQAAVSKGMDYGLKIQVVEQLQFLDIVEFFAPHCPKQLVIDNCDD